MPETDSKLRRYSAPHARYRISRDFETVSLLALPKSASSKEFMGGLRLRQFPKSVV
jgi:hypothetical protein